MPGRKAPLEVIDVLETMIHQILRHPPAAMAVIAHHHHRVVRIRLLQEGAEDFIIKPFNPMELKIRIKKILD